MVGKTSPALSGRNLIHWPASLKLLEHVMANLFNLHRKDVTVSGHEIMKTQYNLNMQK